MKRYDPIAHVSWGEAWGEMEESDDGDYVLHTDSKAEIDRLTAEVETKINVALGRIADMIPSGYLLASADPVGFLDTVAAELKDLRAENVKLRGTVSIKQDRVNDLEKALRDTLRQLERAINGEAMDGDWIAAELHGRECLYA